MTRSLVRFAWLPILAFAVLAGPARAASVETRVVRTLPLPASGLVEVHNPDGDVVLFLVEGSQVRVAADLEARGSSRERAAEILRTLELRTEQANGALRVSVPAPETGGWLGLWGRAEGARADLRVGVPWEAEVRLHARNGDVFVESSGLLAIVKTVNGDVAIRGVGGDRLDASSVNGDISIQLERLPPAASLEASSVNGDIRIMVPESLRAAIDARTTNGCVGSSVNLTDSRKSRSQLVGLVNGGGGQIRVRTTNGEVWVKAQ